MPNYDAAAHREALQEREATLRESLARSDVPAHIHQGLIFYFVHHVEPGSFVSAVLKNDLREACVRADDVNRHALFDIVKWLYNNAPYGSWGSPESFREWLASEPKSPSGCPSRAFPAHWGNPPDIQTQDMVELPAGFGHGSSTLRNWIQNCLDADRAVADSSAVDTEHE